MQNQIKKFMFTPWKRPDNWLNSFKPGNKDIKKGSEYSVIPIVVKKDKLRSSIQMKCNKLELSNPDFRTTKEAFLSRHEFNDSHR